MRNSSLRFRAVFGLIFAFAADVPSLFAQAVPAIQRLAPTAGTYIVPQGWTQERSDTGVILSGGGGEAIIYLSILSNDKRETREAAEDYASYRMNIKDYRWTVISKDIYRYGEKEVSKVTLEAKGRNKIKRQEFILAIPVESGNLVMMSSVIVSVPNVREYEQAISSVMNALLPVAPTNPKPYPASNATVGLKLLVSPSWDTEPVSQGKYSGVAYLKITSGNALLSLSSKQDTRNTKEYVSEVEKNTRGQSKSYEKLSEATQLVAGIEATRLELRTAGADGIPIRRSVLVFSRDNRHYVVAAGAPESEFEKFANDFEKMIASVELAN